MAIIYDETKNYYYWEYGSQRPPIPEFTKEVLFHRFITSYYAQNTSLRSFLLDRPNGFSDGVLNQLHRRHIISWDAIKLYTLCAAACGINREVKSIQYEVINYFQVNVDRAWRLQHSHERAAEWTAIANSMCWNVNNLFIGPSYGNVGTDIDLANETTDELLRETVWRGADFIYSQMKGFMGGV